MRGHERGTLVHFVHFCPVGASTVVSESIVHFDGPCYVGMTKSGETLLGV